MRYALLSDAHGNSFAVEAAFKAISNMSIDSILFCGDIFGYFHSPLRVIERLRQSGAVCVLGNHDDQYLRALKNEKLRDAYGKRYGSSYYENLPKDDERWLRSLPTRIEIQDDNSKILLCHGSPSNELEGRIYPDTEIKDLDDFSSYDYIVIGHYQMLRQAGVVTFVNPGSVGQPRDAKGFSFAVLDTEMRSVKFYSVDSDLEQIRKSVIKNERHSAVNKDYLLRRLLL